MNRPVVIHWFRQDLRLSDNPALYKAASRGRVLPVYILDDENSKEHAMGTASRWWLHYSLQSLHAVLGEALSVYRGDALRILQSLVDHYDVKAVYWNRCYEPWRMARDSRIKKALRVKGIDVCSENGSLLWEPWAIHKNDGTPYKVFTPFYQKGCLCAEAPRLPLAKPDCLQVYTASSGACQFNDLALLPKIRWDKSLEPHWKIGEVGAQERLSLFLEQGLNDYRQGRDFPAKPYVSRLSPHLHFGEVSANQVWYAARACGENRHVEHFCSELGWREFSHYQLYYNQDLPHKNLQPKFDRFGWLDDKASLAAWQQGRTGYPMVDAGMRELWQTGYMHNRVRMIVGSFLVKNLLLHWHHGERWFWDCLIDADLANNSASWQWVAGCGADAAPYFRIFNPVTQGQKFDPEGDYIRHFVPELANLPLKYLFSPWQAPGDVLEKAGVRLGDSYPEPIVDLKASRNRALAAFRLLGVSA